MSKEHTRSKRSICRNCMDCYCSEIKGANISNCIYRKYSNNSNNNKNKKVNNILKENDGVNT